MKFLRPCLYCESTVLFGIEEINIYNKLIAHSELVGTHALLLDILPVFRVAPPENARKFEYLFQDAGVQRREP